jgi:hypothetical protein
MISNREQIFAALFQLLLTSGGFVTTGRKLLHWADVPASMQPALYLVKTTEQYVRNRGVPALVHFVLHLYLYAMTSDPEISPQEVLNPLQDAIDSALLSGIDGEGNQTLGGLVHRCWIEGEVITDEGLLGEQAVARIPINILAPWE